MLTKKILNTLIFLIIGNIFVSKIIFLSFKINVFVNIGVNFLIGSMIIILGASKIKSYKFDPFFLLVVLSYLFIIFFQLVIARLDIANIAAFLSTIFLLIIFGIAIPSILTLGNFLKNIRLYYLLLTPFFIFFIIFFPESAFDRGRLQGFLIVMQHFLSIH